MDSPLLSKKILGYLHSMRAETHLVDLRYVKPAFHAIPPFRRHSEAYYRS